MRFRGGKMGVLTDLSDGLASADQHETHDSAVDTSVLAVKTVAIKG